MAAPSLKVTERYYREAVNQAQMIDHLWRSLAHLLVFQAAHKFRLHPEDVWCGGNWPTKRAKARASVVYILRNSCPNQLSLDDVALLTGANWRTIPDILQRVDDAMDNDQAYEHWVNGLIDTLKMPGHGKAMQKALL